MEMPKYPIRAVAKMTGIGLDTLRAWERRYGAVRPERGERGRVYRDRDVRRLLLLKGLVSRGHSIGQMASLPDARLEELSQGVEPSAERGSSGAAEVAVPAVLRPLFDAVEGFDSAEMDRELGRLALVFPPRALVREVVHPLLQRIGSGWAEGRFSIAQEHLVSAGLRNLVGGMMRLYARVEDGAAVLLATPAGELHEFGILSAALLAAGGGLRTVYLGPNLPAAEIAGSARRVSATVVVLGVIADNPGVEQELRALAGRLRDEIELWVGGREGVLREGDRRKRWMWLPGFDDLEMQLARIGARF